MIPVGFNHQQIRDFLTENDHFVIGSHIRPDGDAIGAVIALGISLQSLGKTTQMILEDGLPASFKFLQGANQVSRKIYPG